MFGLMVPICIWAVYTLNSRLNDSRDESSSLNLKTGNGKQAMGAPRPQQSAPFAPHSWCRTLAHPRSSCCLCPWRTVPLTGLLPCRLPCAPFAVTDVSEFRVGDKASIPSKADIEAAMGVGKSSADERSALLKCAPPCVGGPKQQ